MPAPHPPEFRRRAVGLAREGARPVARLAKDLGISESCLRNWTAQYGSRHSLADQGDVGVAGESGAFVEPSGAGLVAAGPRVPVPGVSWRP